MIAEPLVEVRCAVCAGERFDVVCPAREVGAELQYLRRFHRRRLRPRRGERVPREALADRSQFTQDYATDIVACVECGLLFRNPRPPAAVVTDAYSHDRYGESRLRSLYEAQVELYRPKVRALRRWLGRRTYPRVVEVGSFVGGFLTAARREGWDATGVDPGAEVTDFCRARGLGVFCGILAEAPLPPASVDCVAIWNTFDQLPAPESTLLAARRLMRPGGTLALRVPNGDFFRATVALLRSRRLPRFLAGWLRAAMAWNNLLAFPYLHGYSVRTLDWLLSWHGLQRIAVHGDTLPRLSDADTRVWAAWEEQALKLACRIAAGAAATIGRPGALAPWLDLYYRAFTA